MNILKAVIKTIQFLKFADNDYDITRARNLIKMWIRRIRSYDIPKV